MSGDTKRQPPRDAMTRPPCPICKGELWVCEDHRDVPWRDSTSCCGAAGAPCECNPEGLLPPTFRVVESGDSGDA